MGPETPKMPPGFITGALSIMWLVDEEIIRVRVRFLAFRQRGLILGLGTSSQLSGNVFLKNKLRSSSFSMALISPLLNLGQASFKQPGWEGVPCGPPIASTHQGQFRCLPTQDPTPPRGGSKKALPPCQPRGVQPFFKKACSGFHRRGKMLFLMVPHSSENV